jgi:hypothetical protein
MSNSLAMNILRLSLLLVLIGIFTPIGCNSNGYRLAQGILGNKEQAGDVKILASVENVYGYILLGVFAFALAGLLFTFLSKVKDNYVLGLICLAVSFVFMIITVLKFNALQNSKFTHFILTIFPVKILIGGYLMAIGYLVGVIGFVLKTCKIINHSP